MSRATRILCQWFYREDELRRAVGRSEATARCGLHDGELVLSNHFDTNTTVIPPPPLLMAAGQRHR
jgi:hypothetical protein